MSNNNPFNLNLERLNRLNEKLNNVRITLIILFNPITIDRQQLIR